MRATTTIHWYKEARASVAPHNAEDVKSVRRWRYSAWNNIQHMITWAKNSVHAEDPAIAEPLARVVELTEWKPLTDDECAVFLATVGLERTAEFVASQIGTLRITPLLLAPRIENTNNALQFAPSPKPQGDILRTIIANENDVGVREQCRLLAQAAWDVGDVDVHVALAYAFFFHEPWREQVAKEILDHAPNFDSRHLTFVRDADSMRTLLARAKKTDAIEYVEIVASLGESALPILLELAPLATGRVRKLTHAIALTVVAHEDAARHLAKIISNPPTRGIIGKYFSRHEKLAAAVLPAASEGASRNAALAKELLIKVCGDENKTDEGPLVAITDPAIPSVLRDAPWRTPPAALPDLGLDVTTWESRVDISDAKRKEAADDLEDDRNGKPYMTQDQTNAFVGAQGVTNSLWGLTWEDTAIPLETVLAFYNAGRWRQPIDWKMLAMFGVRALPGLRRTGNISALTGAIRNGIDDAGVAPTVATAWAAKQPVWSWFELHPQAAAFGLLAGLSDATRRRACELALRKLARSGHRETILAATPKAHVEAVRAFLDRDPRLDVPDKPPVLKDRPQVKRPRLKDGRAFADDAIERVFEMLTIETPLGEPYVGLQDLRDACDPRSLAEMTWDLAAFADSSKKWRKDDHDWMRWSLVHFADDEVIRRLTPALKHQTIYSVLEQLAIAGVKSAAMELATAHERGDSTQSLARVATALSTTVNALVETLLPTTPLAEEGTTALQYGPRTLQVGFDTTLAPILFLGEKRLASIPRAQKTDDPIAIRLARERWDELKEDVRTIAHLRCRALIDMIRDGASIPARQFLDGWANHPLGKHQARAVVWAVERAVEGAVERDGALVTFRVAEDSSLADVNDAALTLRDSERIRVPHYSEFDPEELNAWTTTFNDYNLIQPITQLARSAIALEPGEEDKVSIVRNFVTPVPYTALQHVYGDQNMWGGRTLVRTRGVIARFNPQTSWDHGKTMCTNIALTTTNEARENVPLRELNTHDRAELLYLMRVMLEAT